MTKIKTPKKLIEVALPLDDINDAASREKSIRNGHPSTLHLWWARRPLAAARAVIFAQLVNDPGYERNLGRGVNKERAKIERERLFSIMRRLVIWENSNDKTLLAEANAEILKSWHETCELNKGHPMARELFNPERLPAFHDPFAGGGALPLEAQRLGLKSYASDLNPVAVLINKAMIEIPALFANRQPVGSIAEKQCQGNLYKTWAGAEGLAEDVRRYGQWMKNRAFDLIGKYYSEVDLPQEFGGGKSTIIAWLWARTVRSPNPAFANEYVPLATSFVLYSKVGKEVYVEPIIDGSEYRFVVRTGKPPIEALGGTQISRGSFRCLFSDTPIKYSYIDDEANAGRMGTRLMAVVAEGKNGRVYLSPTEELENLARQAKPTWKPEAECRGTFASNAQGRIYGFKVFGDYFTNRQLLALTTFTDLLSEVRIKVRSDAVEAGVIEDGIPLSLGGAGAGAYAEAVTVYLACAISKVANIGSSIASWMNDRGAFRETFARQAIQMPWDFAESNPFADAGGSFGTAIEKGAKSIEALPAGEPGIVLQANASSQSISQGKVISTDPPYYDNIAYADLSDFFYVWLRSGLKSVYPELFATIASPKDEELVASTYRHGSKEKAEAFFLNGMTEAMHRLSEQAHPAFPTTIYYAFKQSDTTDIGTGNTGWETFLQAVMRAGYALTGTWPMRTEGAGRLIARGANALASSIILVCRKRDVDAPSISRRDFIRELKEEMTDAVDVMIGGSEGISPVAPVDLAQAVIGPGMAIFSRYSAVLESDGSSMSVHTALMLINRILTAGGDEFDPDTQFCLGWFDENGWVAGDFGQANVLSQAKGTTVGGVTRAGVIKSASGKVRLLKPSEYSSDWTPEQDNSTPVWEALHHLIKALKTEGEIATGVLLARMPQRAELIRNLAYRLYTLCERKGWAEDARAYNELISSWLGIEAASINTGHFGSQPQLDI